MGLETEGRFLKLSEKHMKNPERTQEMEKTSLPPLLEATFDPKLSLGELLQARMAFARETTGAASGALVRQIAANLHVDPRTISNWLKGRHRPHDDMVQDLADTLAKLIPVPQDAQDRLLIQEKQRRAICSACEKREENPGKTQETLAPEVEMLEKLPAVVHNTSSERPLAMRSKRKYTVLAGAMAALALLSLTWASRGMGNVNAQDPASSGPLISKSVVIGGFEEPELTKASSTLYFPKGQVWKTWGHNGGGIQRNGSGWEADLAPEGAQTAFMHSGDVHMSRDIHIEPGTYSISLYAARRRYGEENPNPVQILINGKEWSDVIIPANTRFQRYSSRSFTVSTAGIYTIEIATRSAQALKGDTFIDKVELNSLESPNPDVLINPFNIFGGKSRSWGR